MSGSVGSSWTSTDSCDAASQSTTTSSSVDVNHHEFRPAEQTHVIASTIDRSMLQSLPKWCSDSLNEVCSKILIFSLHHSILRLDK